MKQFLAFSPYLEDDPLFILHVQEGAWIECVYWRGSVGGDVARWLTRGLVEWVGQREDCHQRVTPALAPEFLPRLSAYLHNSYRIKTVTTLLPAEAWTETVVRMSKYYDIPFELSFDRQWAGGKVDGRLETPTLLFVTETSRAAFARWKNGMWRGCYIGSSVRDKGFLPSEMDAVIEPYCRLRDPLILLADISQNEV